MSHLKLTGVTKAFGATTVIRPTDLAIEEGDFVVFVGPSGCGKSTMLRMIAGLEEVSGGTIEIAGRVVNDLPPVERGISMVFQSYALYPHMSVFENIAFPLRVARAAEDEVRRRVHRAADVLKLRDRLDHRPGALSGGQRQRVAIGRAIVREPSVFLFDEPLSNLDAALRAEMRVELSRLHGQLGNTMIYVTHDQVEAMTMADRIVVLRDGRIEQAGTPLELYHRPANRFVAGFIGNPAMNLLPATCVAVEEAGVTLDMEGSLRVTAPVEPGSVEIGEVVEVGLRPDALVPGPAEGRGLRLTPEVVERLGNQTVCYATTEAGMPVCMTAGGAADLRVGRRLRVDFDPADLHVFRADGTALPRRIDMTALVPPT